DVGGEIELHVPYEPALVCEASLSCLYSYETGSGDDSTRQERVVWQDSGYAQVERTAQGMRLRFRFAVPAGLHPSEDGNGNHYFWRLSVKAPLPGSDLNRSFTIPVYATGESSRFQQLNTGMVVPQGVRELKAESLLPLRYNGAEKELYYPMFRQPGFSLLFMVVGSVFAITGIVLWGRAAQEGGGLYVLGGLFTFLGSLAAMAGFNAAFSSLYVAWDGRRVLTIRRLLGIPIRRRSANYHEVRGVALKKGATSNQNGDSHQINDQVVAQTPRGEIVLAENIDSHNKAKVVEAYFREQFGLSDAPA
ncbi:hypothetical protein, partial [Rhodoferax sp.]|uniref:hypothetical protein n=1 Tax=Rhodoferax sp. TaxID=50421 RepID=UPI00262E7E6D